MGRRKAEPEPIVIAEPEAITAPGRRFWLDNSMFPVSARINKSGDEETVLPMPAFSVKEVAMIFFGRGADWLRWCEKPTPDRPAGAFVLDGEVLEASRTDAGFRYYTLADVERMAHALAQNGTIDGEKLIHVIVMVKHCAQINGVVL